MAEKAKTDRRYEFAYAGQMKEKRNYLSTNKKTKNKNNLNDMCMCLWL